MAEAGRKVLRAPIIFGKAWTEEVERYGPKSVPRMRAETARREIEAGDPKLVWRPCEGEGSDGTHLPGCRKVYVPLGQMSAGAAPYGFIFRLTETRDGLAWVFIAFGERHPRNEASKTVYERAHKRLHGRYP